MRRFTQAICLLVGVLSFGLAFLPQANAGKFVVLDCSPNTGVDLGVRQLVKSPTNAPILRAQNCPYGDDALFSTGAGTTLGLGQSATLRYRTTSGSAFTGVKFDYYKSETGNVPSNYYLNNEGGADQIAIPGLLDGSLSTMPNWYYLAAGQRRTILRGTITCVATPCSTGNFVKFSRVYMEIEDFEAPSTVQQAGGNLLAPPHASGTRSYTALAYDEESGITQSAVLVNNQLAGWKVNPDCVATTRWVPCSSLVETFNFNTTQSPFVEGLNSIRICANDYAATGTVNTTCSPMQYFTVDN